VRRRERGAERRLWRRRRRVLDGRRRPVGVHSNSFDSKARSDYGGFTGLDKKSLREC